MKANYLIKCSHCGTLVPLSGQYMVLCPSCKHKMDNSFAEWQKKNPDGSYPDFLGKMCVSASAIEGLRQQRRISKKAGVTRNLRRMALALGSAIIVAAIVMSSLWLLRGSSDGASMREVMDQPWKINYYDDLQATVKFPYPLEMLTENNIADTTQKIESLVARQWLRKDVANVTALHIVYTPDFGVDRTKGTEQILRSLVADNNMQAFQYIPSDYTLEGTQARMLSGSYLIGNQAYEFRAVMVINVDELWYFMVAYLREQPEGTLLAEKFFKNITL